MDYAIVRDGRVVAGPGPNVRQARSGEVRPAGDDAHAGNGFLHRRAIFNGYEICARRVVRVYVASDLPLEDARAAAHGMLAAETAAVEAAGVELDDGTVLDTGPESRNLLAAELLAAQLDPNVEPEIREKEKKAKIDVEDIENAYLSLMKHVRETNALARQIGGEINGAKSAGALRTIVAGLPSRMRADQLPYKKAKG